MVGVATFDHQPCKGARVTVGVAAEKVAAVLFHFSLGILSPSPAKINTLIQANKITSTINEFFLTNNMTFFIA